MSKHAVIGLLSIIFFIILPLSQGIYIQDKPVTTWYVDEKNVNGPWMGSIQYPFSHIQIAIDTSKPGDIIIVSDGVYRETITISKSLNLQNKASHHPIIDGMYNQSIVQITQPNVNIRGFVIRNSSGAQQSCGIRCNASTITISQCQFYRTKSGIRIEKTANNSISNCLFHTNGEGIAIIDSRNIIIKTNDFTHNGLGINCNHSSFIDIHDCYATINGIGIFLNDSTQITIRNTASFNNNDNQGGIFLNNCEQIRIENSRIEHNGFGIKPFDCKNIFINESTIQYNTHVGVFAERTVDLFLKHCLLTKNFRYSINAANSVLSVHQSNLIASLVGLYAEDSVIHATENYWGSSFGPVFFEHPTIDRVRVKSSEIDLWPVSAEIYDAGVNWTINSSRCIISPTLWLHPVINITGTDSDGDGATDSWEELFGYNAYVWNDHRHLDPDNDGLSNIEECFTETWGSDPFQKDIFLEVDWMSSQTGPPNQNRLSDSDITMMEEIFKEQQINIHVDHGELGGGEEVLYQTNFSYADLRDIYWNYFLHEDLNNPRKGVFHYCIINDWGPGPGFAFVGWDGLDGFDISAQELTRNQPSKDRNILIVGGSIHELGHTLGLTVDDHQGNDNQIATWIFSKQWWRYRQYKSCMNYWYTYRILGFSDGSHGPYDFNDWAHMDLSFFKRTHFDLPDQFF